MDNLIQTVLRRGRQSERLVLRPLRISDVNAMFEYTSDEATCRYLKWGPHTDIGETEAFILKTLKDYEHPRGILWGIELKQTAKLIGVVRIYSIDLARHLAEVSYILNPSFSGKGYMTEAVSTAIDVCFCDLKCGKVRAFLVQGNIRSENVMKRCGMKRIDEAPGTAVIKGEKMPLIKYEIGRGECRCD